MRKLVVVLLVLIAIALGGYSYVWMQKADELKTLVETGLNEANKASEGTTGSAKFITWESLKTSGWPLHVTVSVVNPKIDIPVHAIIAAAPPTPTSVDATDPSEQTAPKPAPFKTWVETIQAQGSLDLTTDLFATNLEVRIWQKGTITSTVDGIKKAVSLSTMEKPLGCKLTMARKEGSYELFPVKTMVADDADFLKRFRAFSCDATNGTLSDEAGGLLFTLGNYDLRFSTDIPAEKLRAFDFTFIADKIKVTPAFDKLNADYTEMVYQTMMPDLPPGSLKPMPMAPLGESSFDIAGRYHGPIDQSMITDPATTALFEISRFNVKNDLMKIDFALLLKTAPEGDKRSFVITSNSTSDFTEQYDAYKAQQFKHLLLEEPLGSLLKPMLENLKPEEVQQALNDVIPSLKPLSPLSMVIDVTYQGANDPMRMMTEPGELSIKNIDFVTALYGIKNEGKGTFVMGNPTQGDLKLSCLSCETMIDRLFSYIKVLDGWASRVDPEKKEMLVSDALHAGVKKFLQSISTPGAEPTTWVYQLAMAANQEPKINGKGIVEIMTSFSENVAPHLPAAGTTGNEGTLEEPAEGEQEQSTEPSIDDATPIEEEGPSNATSDGAPQNAD